MRKGKDVAYLCLNCKCLHGWEKHPAVVKIIRHERGMMEDIWYCPDCNTQHRTTDGSLWGQLYKQWKEIPDVEDFLREEEEEHKRRFYFSIYGGNNYDY